MLVTSLTGLMPVPFQAAYSGTKAFLTAFGTALAHELRGHEDQRHRLRPRRHRHRADLR